MAADSNGRPPRLVYLLTSFNAGGAEWGLVNLLAGGAFTGFDVTVVALVRGAGAQIKALEALGRRPTILHDHPRLSVAGLIKASLRLGKLLRAMSPEVLVLSLPHANLLGRALRPNQPRPLVVSFEHNSRLARTLYEAGYRATSGRVDAMVADCAATATAACERLYDRVPGWIEVLPLVGFPPERMAEKRPSTPPGATLNLVSAGRLTKVKNQERLIDLLATIRRAGLDARLTLFGEGPRRKALKAFAERLGVGAAVALPGHRAAWWRDPADLFLLASRHEGLCIAALEAMAAGIPVAAPLVGGLADYGPAAQMLTLQGGDLEADAGAVVDLLRDAARRDRMSMAGRAMVQDRYTDQQVRWAYEAFSGKLHLALRRRRGQMGAHEL